MGTFTFILVFSPWTRTYGSDKIIISEFRSSHSDVFGKTAVLENFAKFLGKYLCWGLFLNKAAGCRLSNTLPRH